MAPARHALWECWWAALSLQQEQRWFARLQEQERARHSVLGERELMVLSRLAQ
ncbi:MAG TPA: hypothetical protein VIL32_14090 [Steroidobacteraceae bacterium]